VSDAEPVLLILGGINGAGKSTLASELAARPPIARLRFLDPDKVAKELIAARPGIDLNVANFMALRQVAETMRHLLATRESFVTESVLAGTSYRRLRLEAQERGWSVRLLFIGVPRVEDAIARVALRVSKGGHAVPEADIRRRWPRTHENLAWFARHADAVDVFANAARGVPPVLVARVRAGHVELLDIDALPAVTAVLRPLS
jgi:predicted ABC-type ATPase